MTVLKTFTILFLIILATNNLVAGKSLVSIHTKIVSKSQSNSGNKIYRSEPDQKLSEKSLKEQHQCNQGSINFIKTLQSALKIADNEKDKDSFVLHSDTLDIRCGHIFSPSFEYLIVKIKLPYMVSVQIYKLHDNNFVKVCSKDMNPLAYVNDTIEDVNGDGKLDFLFHWYPISGCCLRDIYDVYLQKPNGDFTKQIEFINPNFSSKEKIIRGLCYGYGAPLYKYRWDGYKVDTIEYIYLPNNTNDHHFIRKKHEDEKEKGVIIMQLPKEYKKIGYGNINY
ncbi:hypothetical protein [Microbacter margulisiae]|uniref:Uncharacterized protein n=1 Tax=Microbacter margulisiae TaxID=1350067 RepID=A0A7W5H0Z9_9PORP|nr:hypothetical protein [Microbacter margulisiae]MBB3186109.1 hypothetical protein [Microbacter margulisiae]